jgi:hypothetical protein
MQETQGLQEGVERSQEPEEAAVLRSFMKAKMGIQVCLKIKPANVKCYHHHLLFHTFCHLA